jgi:LmbE family N-acetylglucosaminyl deacetylase
MASLRVYEKGRVGVSVERWEKPKKRACDLLVVSSHRDDELLYFGGTIPYYQSVRGKNVYVMYMSGADRLRHREALAGQWSLGNTAYPLFINFPGGYHDGVQGTLESWGGASYVVGRLVDQIRKYRPKVIVTHGLNGEYGHPTHKTTPRVVKKAIKAAASKKKYRASAKKYGTWKVKKLYLHVYSKNKIRMNYNKPAAELDWKSPYMAAYVAYDKHRSQHGNWSMGKSIVKRYPSDRYGLAYTRVGLDKKKRDFFEHID